MMRVPALVLNRLGEPPKLEMVEIAEPGPDEVRVRVAAAGICHTDLGYMHYARATPVVLGHEGAGIVESVGGQVSHVRPGDHVAFNWQPKCGRCKRCLSGRRDLCEDIQGTTGPRVFLDGQPLHAMLSVGAFSTMAVVPAAGAVAIRKDIPLEKAALLGCAVATGVGAALYSARVQPGDDVVVLGVGGVGLNVVQGARLALAGRIIAVDLDEGRLALARRMGATHDCNSRAADPVAFVLELTGGRGVEHVFEVVGLPNLMQQGIEMLARGGSLTLVGAADRTADFSFQPRRFMSRQQVIRGCIFGNISPELDLPRFADWYLDGRLHLDELHTSTVKLGDLPAIFADGGPRTGIRTVVTMEGSA